MTRLTTPIFGLDAESEVPTEWHNAVHSHFACGYTSRETSKAITRTVYANYVKGDIGCVSVFEDGADNSKMGYAQGKSDATFAEKQTTVAGRPPNRPIFFAIDFDASLDVSIVDHYFEGVAAVLGKSYCGPYGNFAVVGHLLDRGFKWAWQTYAWSSGQLDTRAQLYQYSNDHTVGGVGVDFDHAYYDDYGQWQFKPSIPDTMHYARFYKGPFEYQGRSLDERALVLEYDRLRKHQALHRARLTVLRGDLRACADRIYDQASEHRKKGSLLPEEWSPFWRHWRYPQLITRSRNVQHV